MMKIKGQESSRNDRYKGNLRAFALYLVLAMVFVLVLWLYNETETEDVGFDLENVYNLKEGWIMEGDSVEKEVSLPVSTPISSRRALSFSRTLTAMDTYCNMILFHTTHQYVKVYLDGKLLYSFGYGQKSPIHISVGSAWQCVRLPEDWVGKTLRIETESDYDSYAGLQEEVFLGTKTSLIFMVIKQKQVSLLIDLFLFIMGILLIMISFFFRGVRTVRRIRNLGYFSIVTCTWILLKSGIGQLFSGNVLMSMNIMYLLFGLMPVLIVGFLLTFDTFVEKWYMRALYWYCISVYFIVLFLQFGNFMDFTRTITATHLNYLLIVAALGYCLTGQIMRKERIEELPVYVACFAFAILGSVDIYHYYFVKIRQGEVGFSQAGLICFIGALGYSVVRQASKEQTRSIENEMLKKIAYMDILTDLPNRTAFEQKMEFYRKQAKEASVIVMIVDLNNLKGINDNYGHKSGDIAIIRIASLLKRHFNDTAQTYRIGGDEFCIISPSEPENAFQSKIENFLEDVKRADEEYAFHLEAAYGYVYCKEDGIDKAFIQADKEMYICKMHMKEKEKKDGLL